MKAVRWEDTNRQVRELNPDWDTPERTAARERSRAALRAEQRGYQLAQLRKNTGLTQAAPMCHSWGSPRPTSTSVSPTGTEERRDDLACHRVLLAQKP